MSTGLPADVHALQRQKPTLQTWQYQTMDPWFRINRWHTLSSYRHEACRNEPTAPRDGLDFEMSSEYDHFRDLFRSKAEVLLQKDTLERQHESVVLLAHVFICAVVKCWLVIHTNHEINLHIGSVTNLIIGLMVRIINEPPMGSDA